ncbi:hypothetical protein GMMP15_1900016 [Candidatus Magnetomoraceae bacterium gMMP-15]
MKQNYVIIFPEYSVKVLITYPLKQGLKPANTLAFVEFIPEVLITYPLKQGLKLILYSTSDET